MDWIFKTSIMSTRSALIKGRSAIHVERSPLDVSVFSGTDVPSISTLLTHVGGYLRIYF